jgi:hypothetical protein
MKKLYLIIALVFATNAIAEETKTITPKEFGTAIAETPAKLANFISNEVDKTKEYQKKTWSEAKTKWPWNKIFKVKE